jgi:hypothetical protein
MAGLVPSIPVQDLPSSDRRASILCLEFNHKSYVTIIDMHMTSRIVLFEFVITFSGNILACGDSAGAVMIWKLGERYLTAQNDEIENLNMLEKTFGDN